jgi:3-dehydroquinate dehydratase-2
MGKYEAIIINPAAYTHTSIAIADAIRAVGLPTVEVHLSDVNSREEYRKTSYISEHCVATVSGKGFNSYIDAIEIILSKLK